MPLPPSTTTFNGATLSGSMKPSAAAWKSALTSTSSAEPPPSAFPSPASMARRMSWMPSSPLSGSAPARTSLAPV